MLLLYVLTRRKAVSVVLISLLVGNDKVIGTIGVGTLYLFDECEIIRVIAIIFTPEGVVFGSPQQNSTVSYCTVVQ